ncbi:MAG: pilin domain-containing protein, general secretion pathway protein G [Candidatus Jorgensenbacteria bacterium GW2011_GWC1_48_8]|uniref:Pilin domain-containing protein, general secretion pathway protein G n=1 Tax=Candidatus Jorgensenbacteria bacterium GW2011_GWC1_48_8 TaxID=1618666 RepID=A0A0G1UXJ5_9BACT|nr:MAG: pilin domain-containing protein, general secretion pathway protein G [Candidatus Jorgensenbacteria bacterium GW2011_GWC1_48_8]
MKNNKGFTLIEMLVVIAIIGLLSSVVIIGLGGSRSKARDARRIADIQQIQNALELQYNPATGYPVAGTPPTATITGAPTKDPQSKDYQYAPNATTLGYNLGICLENSEGASVAGNCPSGVTNCSGKEYCVKQ